jgi:hypothetical protein
MPKLLGMDAIKDIFNELLNPLVRLLVRYLYVTVVVIPQATWDLSKEDDKAEGIKKPVSQSAAIILMNISNSPVEISDAGICFKDGSEWPLSEFGLSVKPVEIEGYNRREFVLDPSTFEKLKRVGLENVKHFYLEDRLFHRFKARLSKKDIDMLLKPYYLVKSA